MVTAVISFLSYFSDFGLAAALIQKKEEPTRAELVSAFTIQQLLVLGICVISFIMSPFFGKFYGLSTEGVLLLQALLVSFFLSSLKTIPSVLLERQLKFELLVIPQILETLSFYVVAILFAVLGQGVISFAWAAVVRGFVGLIAIYIIYPWPVGLGISSSGIKHLLKFGIPFQMNSLLSLIKDDLMTLFLGKMLPITQVGYLGWAKKWGEAPLRLIMDNIIRVTFPAYARLQENKEILGKALSKSFFFLGLFIFPISTLLILFIDPMIYLIPKYIKWQPALVPFYLYTTAAIFSAFSSPLVNALNAIGKIKSTLKLMVFWTVLTWVLIPILSVTLGFQGAAVAALIISFTSIIPILMIRRIIYFGILPVLYKPIISTLVMLVPTYIILRMNIGWESTVAATVVGLGIYTFLVWYWMKDEIAPYLPRFGESPKS